MPLVAIVLAALAGYLIGAIPTGVVVGRIRGVDPRGGGSGRTGATNALRTLGPALAAGVLLVDVAKGIVAALLGGWLAGALAAPEVTGWAAGVAGVTAVVGHVRSIFIGFAGGRGVATGGGAMLVLAPLSVAVALPAMLVIVAVTRYVSLGSLVGAWTVAVLTAVQLATGSVALPAVVAAVAVALVVTLAHADNIERLRDGSERRLGHG